MKTGKRIHWHFAILMFATLLTGLAGLRGAEGGKASWLSGANRGQRPPTELVADISLGYVPGELLVKFFDGVPSEAALKAAQQVGARPVKTYSLIGVQHWRLGRGVSVERALQILSGPQFHGHVEFAEPNYLIFAANVFPNDARLGELWGLHNIGQTGGKKDADVDAPAAWEITQGSAEVVVGVIDTGIDYLHEDLAANIWTNPAEVPGNGVDDDGNGYVDDVRGWDFVNNDNDPMDDHWHGTHVAGTIAAVGNNGVGVAGLNWHVKLIPLKFLDQIGTGTTSDAVEAIQYAASFGVRITNNSWGSSSSSKSLERAIAKSGALFVASAGNTGGAPGYPAALSLQNILSVAATDENDVLATFSSYDAQSVDLGAPGVKILSCVTQNKYGHASGTSMAAPHVAGAASLLLAQDPLASVLTVKNRILASVDPVPSLQGKTLTGGRLNVVRALGGSEAPDADASAPAAVTSLAVDLTATTSNSVSLYWTAPADTKADGTVGPAYVYDIRYRAGETIAEADWSQATQTQGEPRPDLPGMLQSFVVTGLLPGTTYHFALKAADEAGNFSALSSLVLETTGGLTPGQGWVFETVDPEGAVGHNTALAYDPTGNPSIAYVELNTGTLKFARRAGPSWQIETVDTTGLSSPVDLAYDPAGKPCIAYGWGKLKFACKTGTSWKVQTVEKQSAYNDVVSLAFSPATGYPAISYRNIAPGGLKLARWTGSAWATEFVSSGGAGRYNSLAFDVNGNPSIAYADDVDGDGYLDTLKFARWSGSSWQIQVVESGGIYASLAYDPATGQPSISHGYYPNGRFARWNGSSWEIEVVDERPTYGNSLRYDSSNAPWVAYLSGGVKVARRNGTTWEQQIVELTPNAGYVSLQFDAAGLPSLTYMSDSYDRDLKFARKQSQ